MREKLEIACARVGITPGYGRSLCKSGDWPGAEKAPSGYGGWMVPAGSVPRRENARVSLSDSERTEMARRKLAGERAEDLAPEYGVTANYVYVAAKKFRESSEDSPLSP